MQLIPNCASSRDNEPVRSVLHYLEHDLPGYQFDAQIDMPFVLELLADFPEIDILEELKNFRWYHDNAPFSGTSAQRVSIRRWIARTAARSRYRPYR
jgi:hypothetical protein